MTVKLMDLIIPALLWRSIPQNGSDMLQIVIQTPTPPDTPRMLQLSRGKNYSPAHARHMPLEPKKAKSHHLATPRVSIWDLPASILEPGGLHLGCLRLCFLPLGLHFGPLAPILVVLVPTRPTQRNPMGYAFRSCGPTCMCSMCGAAVRACAGRALRHVREQA